MTHSLLRTGSDRSRLVRTGPFKYLVKGTGFDFLQVRLHLGREPVPLMTCTQNPHRFFRRLTGSLAKKGKGTGSYTHRNRFLTRHAYTTIRCVSQYASYTYVSIFEY